jgi:acyl carrier protein phosphodiesterase
MNYLAHFLLLADQREHWLGSFFGDFARGALDRHPKALREGIRLHRRVDTLTDVHPETRSAARILRPALGRWSGVAVDVLFDHALASRWNEWAPEFGVGRSLPEFARSVYDGLGAAEEQLPEFPRRVAWHMAEEDWLTSYARLDAIEGALSRMEARIAARRRRRGLPEAFVPLRVAASLYAADPEPFLRSARNVLRDVRRGLESSATV